MSSAYSYFKNINGWRGKWWLVISQQKGTVHNKNFIIFIPIQWLHHSVKTLVGEWRGLILSTLFEIAIYKKNRVARMVCYCTHLSLELDALIIPTTSSNRPPVTLWNSVTDRLCCDDCCCCCCLALSDDEFAVFKPFSCVGILRKKSTPMNHQNNYINIYSIKSLNPPESEPHMPSCLIFSQFMLN